MNLKQLQSAFGHALRHGDSAPLPGDGAADYAERFDTYRNNAWQSFASALEQTYPVVQRRVGTDFFRQLAREYRAAHPSRRGDLHWAGADFPAWLATRMAASGYEWLADLARLEWAFATATVSATAPSATLAALAAVAPESLAQLRLVLHPSLHFVASPFPIWSVWQANQGNDETGPVDLAQGAECCVVACVADQAALYRLDPVDFRVLERLAHGDSLGDALDAASADADVLARVVAWAFAEQLVTATAGPADPA